MQNHYWYESRQTIKMALPFIANQLLQMSMATIDILMAGRDSNLTLAATSQGVALWILVVLAIIGLLLPMTAMVAKAYARDDSVQLRVLFQQAVWLTLPLGVIGALVMWWLPSAMFLIGVDADIVPPATDYLRIVAFGVPLVGLFLPVRFFTEGIGFPKAIMVMTALSMPINVMGNYVFLNGLFGIPPMGAAGIALSTLISQVFLFVLGWWFMLRHKSMRAFAVMRGFSKPLKRMQGRFFQLGIPSAVFLLMEAGMFTLVILLSGRLGVDVAAANQIAINYISNTFMVPLGMSMALTMRIGMAMGENNLLKARTIGVSGMLLGAAFMALSITVIFILGERIASWYSDEKQIIAIATSLLAIAGIFQIFDGVQVCASGALRGLEETQAPMQYAGLGYWLLGIPVAILLAFPMGLGAQGLWWGLLVGLSVTSTLCARKFVKLTNL